MARHGDGFRQGCDEDTCFVLSGDADASDNHTLYFQDCRKLFGNEVLLSDLHALDAANRSPWISMKKVNESLVGRR